MLVWINIRDGNHRHERTFVRVEDARAYLKEWGCKKTLKGKKFSVDGVEFELSHDIHDIFHTDLLDQPTPENPAAPTATTTTKKAISTTPQQQQSGLVCLKDVCRRIDMEPRTARQKLRKHFKGNGKQRWEWPESEVPKIIEVLKDGHKGG